MRRNICLPVIILLTVISSYGAIPLPDADYHYVIRYKWGLIEKEAATATLSLTADASIYHARLAVATLPWADHVLRVRDTLYSEMNRPSCLPVLYAKDTHQGHTVQHDVLRYTRSGNEVIGRASRFKQEGDNLPQVSDTILYANGPTLDMLSVFYWIRELDFPSMQDGSTFNLSLFSAYTVTHLEATYHGQRTISFDGNTFDTYYISFRFTSNGRETEDPMRIWLSADDIRIPVKLVGVLSLGKVEAFYQP